MYPQAQGLTKTLGTAYVAVAASQTAATLSTGNGTYIARLICTPATLDPGAVTLLDGTGSGLVTLALFAGGTGSVTELKPFVIELGFCASSAAATSLGWRLTTGAAISVVAVVQTA